MKKGTTRKNRSFKNKLVRLSFYLAGVVILACAFFFLLVYLGAFGPLPGERELAALKDERATLVFSADNKMIGKIFAKNRTPISLDILPKQLIDALIVTEDIRFYEHNGIDGRSLVRVIFKTILLGNKSAGGGSTITQQLAKNLYGREDFGKFSLAIHKIRESILAVRLEKVFSKEEILILYLNSVPLGEDVYGIEAASNRYFNKHVGDLTTEESALLIGMLKGNTYYHPRLHPERALDRRNLIIDLLHQHQKISDEQAKDLKDKPLSLDYSNLSREGPAQYFLFQVEKEARRILEDLKKENGESFDIEKDGLRIETTLDSRLQELARSAIKKHLQPMQLLLDKDPGIGPEKRIMAQRYDPQDIKLREIWTWDGVKVENISESDSAWHYHKMLHAGMLALEPGTGKIRVWIGGNHFRYLPYDLVLANRMIASAFKPVIYATALEEGFEPCDYFDNEIKTYEKYDDWTPRNYDGSSGDEVAMWYALSRSLNLPTVDLFFRIGFKRIEEMCFRLGIEQIPDNSPSIALGALDLSLWDMVPIYGTFADAGRKSDPVMIERILDSNDQVIYKNNPGESGNILDAEITHALNAMLQNAVNQGTGSRLRSQFKITAELAGKTGTSQNYSDAWFYYYNPGLVCGIWVGAHDPKVHFSSGTEGSGSSLALPIAGYMIKRIEGEPSLKKDYLKSFNIPVVYRNQMACESIRTKGALNRFFENVFGKKEEQDTNQPEESKVKRFFKNLFGKKKK